MWDIFERFNWLIIHHKDKIFFQSETNLSAKSIIYANQAGNGLRSASWVHCLKSFIR